MEFTNKPLKRFGRELATIEVPTKLTFKGPLVYRLTTLLVQNSCVAAAEKSLAALCFDEALTNSMTHGNKLDPTRKIKVELFCDEKNWGVIIEDEGEGFNPDRVVKESAENLLEEAGRGIRLIEGYVDALLYAGKGNKLMMTRHRDKVEAPPAVQAKTESTPAAAIAGLMAEPFDFSRASREGGVAILEILEPRLSDINVATFKSDVNKALEACKSMVLDLSHVQYVSSVAIGVMIYGFKSAKAKGGQLKICGVQPVLKNILKVAGLERLVEILPDKEAALGKLR